MESVPNCFLTPLCLAIVFLVLTVVILPTTVVVLTVGVATVIQLAFYAIVYLGPGYLIVHGIHMGGTENPAFYFLSLLGAVIYFILALHHFNVEFARQLGKTAK